jgi:hypothetical protein
MKTLMYITLAIIFVVGLFLLMANTSISFNPFSIKMGTPLFAIAYILIMIAVCLIMTEKYHKGHDDGYKEGFESCKHIEQTELDKYYFIAKSEDPAPGTSNVYKTGTGKIIIIRNENPDTTAQTN